MIPNKIRIIPPQILIGLLGYGSEPDKGAGTIRRVPARPLFRRLLSISFSLRTFPKP